MEATLTKNENYTWEFVKNLEISWKYHGILSLWKNGNPADNDNNESTHSLDTTVAFGELETDGHLGNPLPNNQLNLSILAREIHSLWQLIEAGEGQPTEGLDCIDCLERDLENLSHTWVTTDFNPNTYGTIWRSSTPIYGHAVQHTEVNRSHKFPTTGHCHLQ